MDRKKNALVVGAHPDDCALGAAGISVLLRRAGWSVTFLTMTDGELGGDPQVRIAEEHASAHVLGVQLDLCHMRDGAIDGPGAVRVLEEKLAYYRPDLILTHEPTDSHSDHRVLSDSLLSAARRHASMLFYEGPSTQSFAASLRLDISSAWDLKVDSLLAHASQRERVRTVEWAESIGRHRAWPHYRGVCEAFVPARLNMDMLVPAHFPLEDSLPNEDKLVVPGKSDWSVS